MKRILIAVGMAVALLALLAPQLGLDTNADWGRGRTALLFLGIIIFGMGLIFHFWETLLNRWWNVFSAFVDRLIDRQGRISVVSVLALILIFSAYLWFIQLGQRDVLREYDYYIELARGFKDGHLYLEEKPSAALLSLENPYDYGLRKEKGVEDFTWDLSLYKGKFYIYWGPVPSVLVMFFSRKWLDRIGDFHLALVFASSLYIYMVLLLSTYWRRSFSTSPAWLLFLLLLVGGLSTPITIMLKGAKIYEAAILGCQFFFIGGCFWLYRFMLDGDKKAWLVLLASIHWALAVGTRVIVLPAVAFAAGFTILYIYKNVPYKAIKDFSNYFLALSLPLVVVGAGLAIYNFARFESIFEFGLTYQLANVDYTQFQHVFSLSRVQQNLYIYFLHPIKILSRFPYLHRVEYLNSNDRMAGLLYVAPFIILSIPVIWLFESHFKPERSLSTELDARAGRWLYNLFACSGVVSFFIIMSYYFVAMRFIQDFMPALLMVAAIQAGSGYEALQNHNFFRRSLGFIVFTLGVVTIFENILLAVPDSGIAFAVNFLNTISKLLGLR